MGAPEFLEKKPEPQEHDRHFGGRRLHVWFGYVRFDKVEGWVDNPRIDLQRKRMKEAVGNRTLAQDEVFEIMKNDSSVELKGLRDDILKNELKEPIILSKSRRLLDGNRRFFAVRYLLETMGKEDPNRADYEKLPCYVLSDSTTEEDEERVLVEENFSPSLKQEWPDYVKSNYIREEIGSGHTTAEISEKYNWSKRKIAETVKIIRLIDDFCAFAEGEQDPEDEYGGGLGLSETEAERIAADNYQYFNEAQKSFRNQLDSNIEFKVTFFRWISTGKFKSFPEVRIAYDSWSNPEARSVLESDDPGAAKEAKAIIDYGKRVIKGKTQAKERIEEFLTYLEGLGVAEVKGLPDSTVEKIRHALELVGNVAELANKEG